MENIVEPNETFDFSKLSLAHPTSIQGGSYFTKIEFNKKPLYVQTTKSQTKQGFIKIGKKYYCDLIFDKNAESLVNWFESLEKKCKTLIFERRETWFQATLEESDIENAFNSTTRILKSGKLYSVRTNIKNNQQNLPQIKIYDEEKKTLSMDDVDSETNVITILEIQGIKFTSRNFQIEIELKQVMVLNNELIFDSCLFKNCNENLILNKSVLEEPSHESLEELLIDNKTNAFEFSNKDLINNFEASLTLPNNKFVSVEPQIVEPQPQPQIVESQPQPQKENNIFLDIDFEDLNENIEENTNYFEELQIEDLSFENTLETMQLKKPQQVYFELYKEARNKAKTAKKNALLAYLEAKNIKKTYLLEDLNDSESDFDAEIDDVSESELDSLKNF
jgi:hypothetical protein